MSQVTVEIIPNESWEGLSELAHQVCFGEARPTSLNRHHFVIGVFGNKELAGYFTCIEMDSETAYIQYGGAFPNYEKSIYVVPGYLKMLDILGSSYKRAWTRVENTNVSMLKLALHAGFIVAGASSFKGKLFLELTKDFGGN